MSELVSDVFLAVVFLDFGVCPEEKFLAFDVFSTTVLGFLIIFAVLFL